MYNNYYYNADIMLDEVMFWSEISKEHPYVISSFAEFLTIDIPDNLMEEVMKFSVFFDGVQREAKELLKNKEQKSEKMYAYNEDMDRVMDIITAFKTINSQFLKVLNDVKKFGEENKLWQTLLEHIMEEQNYAQMVMDKFQPPQEPQMNMNQYQF